MGAVYKARQKSLGRLVALKILAPQHAANPDFAERFAREAKVLAEVSHPNIVTVHDFGQAGEFYFLTMEFVDGVNLRQAMKAGRLTPQQALAIVPPICEALQFAHDRGIVHRDIKPENLLLDKEGRVKIADFGIARMLRVGQAFQPDEPTSNAGQAGKPDLRQLGLTQESVLGTPSYMAPEQREHPSAVDHRADIFSLGVVLYEMLTGELPGSKLQAPSRKVEIDVRLDEIVLRALEQQPELRFQTAAEFRTRVTSIANGDAAKPGSASLDVIPQSATQPFSARTSGVLMLLIGAFFVLAFLFGGGVATSTQGGTAVAIFFVSYILGLLFPGLLVYQSAVASTCHVGTPQPVSAKSKRPIQWLAIVLAFLWIPVSMAFFHSEAFATPIGQNGLLIFIGVCLAQFVPLGLGMLHREPRQSSSDEKPHRLFAADWSIPQAMGLVAYLVGLVVLTDLVRWLLNGAPVRSIEHVASLVLGACFAIAILMGAVAARLSLLKASRQCASESDRAILRSCLRAASVVGFLISLPVIGFAGFFAIEMMSEIGHWNPSPPEAIFVPLTWVGAIALPWASIKLWRVSSQNRVAMVGDSARCEGQSSNDLIADDRSQRHKIAIAASIVWLVTGMVVGTVTVKGAEVRFRYDFEWLALTLFLLSTAVLVGISVSKSIKRWCEKRDRHSRSSLFGWLRAVAVLGFLMMIPFVMFTTGLLGGLVSQLFAWEWRTVAVLFPIGLIGFFALPWASVVLWQARFLLTAATDDPLVDDARRKQHRLIVIGTGLAMLIAVVISVPSRPQPVEVTTRHATVENGHYTFEYSVQTVPGWNVWLTLENAQLFQDDGNTDEPRGPVVVSRYQAKLVGNGRVRVPLEYLPTTDEELGKMRASIGPHGGFTWHMAPKHNLSVLAYQTESLMRVWAILMMLPEGQTPDSLLVNEPTGSPASPRYKTIEPPAQPTLGPFEGAYDQGRVELFALGAHPPNGQPFWKPNGELLAEAVPELGGSNTASGRVMKEIVVRVHSATGLAATPVIRFRPNSGYSAMGGAFHRPDDKQPFAMFHGAIACPPDAREMTVEVGVADGDWHKEIEFARLDGHPHNSLTTTGNRTHGTWSGVVRSASIVGNRVPIAFSYSRRDDGSIVPLIGEGSDGNGGMINSLTTLPVAEFKSIKHFRVESRRYQWIEFRNVSLQLGHRTQVEVR